MWASPEDLRLEGPVGKALGPARGSAFGSAGSHRVKGGGSRMSPRVPPVVARVLSYLAFVVLASAAVGCAGGRRSPSARKPPDLEGKVKAVALVYQMKGHLVSSRELWGRGDVMARSHAAHPRAELFSIVADDLKATDPAGATRLVQALERLETLVARQTAADEVRQAYESAFAAVDGAARALAGERLGDPTFVAQVTAELLEAVTDEYAEAVQEGRLQNLEEYQDAYGFLQVARELFGKIAEATRAADGEKSKEVERVFGALSRWLPAAATPPNPPADPAQVSAAVRTARAALGEAHGFTVVEATAEERLAWIRERVERALREYQAGHRDEAHELAASAYLDGFEHLEGELLGKDRKLVETLETQFRQLRDGIRADAPVEELRGLQREIEANLARAAGLLRGGR